MLDAEKAFDSVWHEGLIHKLDQINTPLFITKIIQSYLTNRSFILKVGNATSKKYLIPAGVPQGAVLSPTLYNIYTSDIPTPPNSELYQYADDTAILVSAVEPTVIISHLERGIQMINDYFHKWKIQLNVNKTQAVFCTRRRATKYIPQHNLRINGTEIPWSEKPKYLGIILDPKLIFNKHIEHSIAKISKLIKILYPLINRRSHLSRNNKVLLHKAVFLPILTYGSPVWGICAKTHINKLQICQNKTLKLIYNLPWHYSTKKLHQIGNIKYIQNIIDLSTVTFLNSLAPLNNHLLDQPIPTDRCLQSATH